MLENIVLLFIHAWSLALTDMQNLIMKFSNKIFIKSLFLFSVLQQNSRGSSDFCVKNIDHAAFGRREIEIAETGKIRCRTTKPTKWHVLPSEDSDQPGHPPSLIRVFTVRMKKAWVLSYLLSTQRRLWSDWADAQADLSLCWVHLSFWWFCHEVAQMFLLLLDLMETVRKISWVFGEN